MIMKLYKKIKFEFWFGYIKKDYLEINNIDMSKTKLKNILKSFAIGQISWSEFSSEFSKEAIHNNYFEYEFCIPCRVYSTNSDHDCKGTIKKITDVDHLGYLIHENWIHALQLTRYLLDVGFKLNGQSYEKSDSQHDLLVPYSQLDRSEQLKDIYCIKSLTPKIWEECYKSDDLDREFQKNNINW